MSPSISAVTLLNCIPTLIVWSWLSILLFSAVLRSWHTVVQFSQFRSGSFLVFGQQNLCLALSHFFWEAEWPPLIFELWSCTKNVSSSPWCTKNCFCVPMLPSSCHFMYSMPSVSTFWSQKPHIAMTSSSTALVFAFLIYKSLQAGIVPLCQPKWIYLFLQLDTHWLVSVLSFKLCLQRVAPKNFTGWPIPNMFTPSASVNSVVILQCFDRTSAVPFLSLGLWTT